jgi:hypothetical protein
LFQGHHQQQRWNARRLPLWAAFSAWSVHLTHRQRTANADFPFDWSTATNQNHERSLTSFTFFRDKVPHSGEITFTVQGFTQIASAATGDTGNRSGDVSGGCH